MEFTAQQIADLINGQIVGEPEQPVSGFGKIQEAKPQELTFLGNDKYSHFLKETNSQVIIISKKFKKEVTTGKTFIIVEDAYQAITQLLQMYESLQPKKNGIMQPTSIAENAQIKEKGFYLGEFSVISSGVKIGENVKIYPQVYIGENVEIGDNTIIYPGVKIYENIKIGRNVIIQSNSVIGCEGFGYQPDENGVFKKVPQLGNVIIENDVEIGACSTIDRATMGSTLIKEGTKLDNQIQIAHNVEIGRHNVIAAQSGVAGSTKIGHHNMIGGQVGVTGHLKIGNKIQVQAQSGVNHDVKDGEKLYGSPAFSAMDFRKSYVHFKNFSKIVERLNKLEKLIKKENHGG